MTHYFWRRRRLSYREYSLMSMFISSLLLVISTQLLQQHFKQQLAILKVDSLQLQHQLRKSASAITQSALDTLKRQIKQQNRAYQDQKILLQRLNIISQQIPPTAKLQLLSLQSHQVVLNGDAYSETVANQYLQQLQRQPSLHKLQLSQIQYDTQQRLIAFRFSLADTRKQDDT